MLAAAFVSQGMEALRSPINAGEAARPTVEGLQKLPGPVSANVPSDPEVFAKLTAAVQIGGGLLLAGGRVPRVAAAMLAATVPAGLGAHMFWSETDPARRARQRRDFMVDVSLLGGLIIASADTAGKPSLSWRGRRAAKVVTSGVSGALAATGAAAEGTAAAAAPVVEAARRHTADLAGAVQKKAETSAHEGARLAGEVESGVRRLVRR